MRFYRLISEAEVIKAIEDEDKSLDIILTNDLFTHQAKELCMQGSAGPTWPEDVEHSTNKESSG